MPEYNIWKEKYNSRILKETADSRDGRESGIRRRARKEKDGGKEYGTRIARKPKEINPEKEV